MQAARIILAEVGAEAVAFATAAQLASWAGVCPGREESAGVSHCNASPNGSRHLRRILNQIAWAAIRTKGSYFQIEFERWVARLGPQKAAWAIARKILRLIWKVLKQRVRYQEHGTLPTDPTALKRLRLRHTAALKKLGLEVTSPRAPSKSPGTMIETKVVDSWAIIVWLLDQPAAAAVESFIQEGRRGQGSPPEELGECWGSLLRSGSPSAHTHPVTDPQTKSA